MGEAPHCDRHRRYLKNGQCVDCDAEDSVVEAARAKTDAIEKALEVARRFGGTDGDHHKAWVIDQMVRALTGDGYQAWVADANSGDDGPNTYEWDEGITP